MRKTYREYGNIERNIRQCARSAGLPTFRAAAIATRLTTHPLRHEHAARLLAQVVHRLIPAPVLAAHRLLASVERTETPPLLSIRVAPLDDLHGACDRGRITIDPTSPMYRAAEAGDLWPLAMLLHHEQQHARGADEPKAFAASLKFVQRYRPHDIALLALVRRAAAASLEKRRSPNERS